MTQDYKDPKLQIFRSFIKSIHKMIFVFHSMVEDIVSGSVNTHFPTIKTKIQRFNELLELNNTISNDIQPLKAFGFYAGTDIPFSYRTTHVNYSNELMLFCRKHWTKDMIKRVNSISKTFCGILRRKWNREMAEYGGKASFEMNLSKSSCEILAEHGKVRHDPESELSLYLDFYIQVEDVFYWTRAS